MKILAQCDGGGIKDKHGVTVPGISYGYLITRQQARSSYEVARGVAIMRDTDDRKYSTNEAEYLGILAALAAIKALGLGIGAKGVTIQSDSLLAINQINGVWNANKNHLALYLLRVKHLAKVIGAFTKVSFMHIRREKNQADSVVRKVIV